MSNNPLTGYERHADEAMDEWDDRYPVREGFHKIRRHPKGIKLYQVTPEKVVFSMRTALNMWWMLPYLIAYPWGMLAFALSLSLGGSGYGYDGDDVIGIIMLFCIFGLAPWVVLFVITNPKVTVTATKDTIEIGSYRFDRRYFTRTSIGFQIDSTITTQWQFGQRSGGDTQQFFWSQIRIGYGKWGENIKYLLNRDHAAEYLTFMNEMIDFVGQVEREPTIEEGYREQKF